MRWIALAFGVFALAVSVLASTGASGQIARVVGRLPGGDVTGHFLLTGLLTLFGILGFTRSEVAGRRLGAFRCALAVGLLVTIDELVQIFLPNRSFSLADLGASYAGVVSFGLVGWWLQPARAG